VSRGKRMEYVIVEGCIPLFVAEESVETNEGWVPELVTPCIIPILQVYFIKLAVIECRTEKPH